MIERYEKDYELGRRHLANIMGIDPDEFTQKDIDVSLEESFEEFADQCELMD